MRSWGLRRRITFGSNDYFPNVHAAPWVGLIQGAVFVYIHHFQLGNRAYIKGASALPQAPQKGSEVYMDIREIPRTNEKIKLQYIQRELQQLGIATTLHTYVRAYERGGQNISQEFYNLYTRFESKSPDAQTVLVTAHWDTVISDAENCLDNTASVYNVCRLIEKFNARQEELPFHLVLALTDAEEGCSIFHNGALEMAIKYDPVYHIDLELTAGGTIPLVDSISTPLKLSKLQYMQMPYNNCLALRHALNNPKLDRYNFDCKLNNLKGAACLTLVTESDLEELVADFSLYPHCSRWSQCHSKTDLFDTWLNLPEMEAFTDAIVEDLLKWDLNGNGT